MIPFKAGEEAELGPKVNDTYFGKVPPEYLTVEADVLFFKGDGTRRGKIGISPQRSKGIAGSYDADGKVLTIVTYNVQEAPQRFRQLDVGTPREPLQRRCDQFVQRWITRPGRTATRAVL